MIAFTKVDSSNCREEEDIQMNQNLIARLTAFLGMVLILAMLAPSQGKQSKPASPAKDVQGSGCVEAGVEAGCVVLKDFKTHKLYNLFFSADKPAIGTAIHFVGKTHDGPTICMQGQPVEITKWNKLKTECPKPTDTQAKELRD
jgi:hypothetical protein